MTVTAAEAGQSLSTIATRLLEADILQQEGFAVLQRVAGEIRRLKDAVGWSFEVDRGQPIRFAKVLDRSGLTVTPAIVSKRITVGQTERHTPPFDHLDMALEIDDDHNQPVARWHLDLANEAEGGQMQSGPLIHLQFGGHHHGAGELDHPLKMPRWCHPPMELGLLCEVVAANFYEEAWLNLRDDANWCRSVHTFQKLCYSNYIEKLNAALSVSSSTALNVMWANDWR